MTHCRKFCFKTALFCAVVVKSKEKWGQGEFLESKSDRFHSLSASANNQEKQKDWKYKRDFFFFFFLTVGEKIATWTKCISKQCIFFL